MAENRGMLADGNQHAELSVAILRRLAERLPSILSGATSGGRKITIDIAQGGKTVRIDWPSEQDVLSTKNALP